MVITNLSGGGGKAVRQIQSGWIWSGQATYVGTTSIPVHLNSSNDAYNEYHTTSGAINTIATDKHLYYRVPISGFKNVNKIEINIDTPANSSLGEAIYASDVFVTDTVLSAFMYNNMYNEINSGSFTYYYKNNVVNIDPTKLYYYIGSDATNLAFAVPFSLSYDSSKSNDRLTGNFGIKKDKVSNVVSDDNNLHCDFYSNLMFKSHVHYTVIEYY